MCQKPQRCNSEHPQAWPCSCLVLMEDRLSNKLGWVGELTKWSLYLSLQFLMQGKAGRYAPVFQRYQQKAESFMCSCLGKGTRNIQRTPGGLIFRQRWNNMQFVTSSSFLTAVYSDYLSSAGRSMMACASGNVSPSELLSFTKSQVMQSYQLLVKSSVKHILCYYVEEGFLK